MRQRREIAERARIADQYVQFSETLRHLRRHLLDFCRIGEVDRHVTRAVELTGPAPRQRHNVAPTCAAEVPQRGISDQAGRTRHDYFLVCHSMLQRQLAPSVAGGAGYVSGRS